MSKICSKCGKHEHYGKGLCHKCYSNQYYTDNINKIKTFNKIRRELHPDKYKAQCTKANRKRGHLPMSENRMGALFLGVHVAERVLSNVFKDVIRQPHGNPGFDFICNKGKKIDVKCSCLHYREKWGKPYWQFKINKNKIADYFLCLSIDDRINLNPKHMWLLPADKFNNQVSIAVSTSKIDKWNQYSVPVDKVTGCCEVLKDARL